MLRRDSGREGAGGAGGGRYEVCLEVNNGEVLGLML